jgi:hypothetical protein
MKGLETLPASVERLKGQFKRTFIYSLGSKMLGETECGVGRQSGKLGQLGLTTLTKHGFSIG